MRNLIWNNFSLYFTEWFRSAGHSFEGMKTPFRLYKHYSFLKIFLNISIIKEFIIIILGWLFWFNWDQNDNFTSTSYLSSGVDIRVPFFSQNNLCPCNFFLRTDYVTRKHRVFIEKKSPVNLIILEIIELTWSRVFPNCIDHK